MPPLVSSHASPVLHQRLSILLGLALAACSNSRPEPNTAASADSASNGAADCADPALCPPLPPQCRNYLKTACETVGKDSNACSRLRAVAPLLPPEACSVALEHLDYTRQSAANTASPCQLLADRLCKSLGPDTETCQLIREKTPSFPDERCESILRDNYDEVLADLQQQEAGRRPLTPEKWATASAGNAPSFGPPEARVVLVEFSDFQCPYCARAAEVTQRLKAEYGDKVRFVFRQFPLQFHEHAMLAAQAALAAHAQGKFWEFHDALFNQQDRLARSDLEALAATLGLDVEAFKSALDSGAYKAAVDDDYTLGESLPVLGTPTLFLNGARVENPTDFDEVSGLIGKQLAE